jgi:CHAD domain-containing protein
MISKIEDGLDKNGKPFSLKSVLEKDISKLNAFSSDDYLNIDKSIHSVRKSLKSISAILLLCEVHFDREQYSNWKLRIKSLSKQYGLIREPYVYLQTFNGIEKKLKNIDNSNLNGLKNNLESQYDLILKDIKNREGTIQTTKESIIQLSKELSDLDITIKNKPLKRRLLISFSKSQRLFKKLKPGSTANQYHQFRKWCKIFYYQRIVLNRTESDKMSKERKKLYKLTEFLGNEHNLQVFLQYLSIHFPEFSKLSEAVIMLKIKRIRKKALNLYPKISY